MEKLRRSIEVTIGLKPAALNTTLGATVETLISVDITPLLHCSAPVPPGICKGHGEELTPPSAYSRFSDCSLNLTHSSNSNTFQSLRLREVVCRGRVSQAWLSVTEKVTEEKGIL